MGLFTWAARAATRSTYRVFASISDELAKERRLRLTDGEAWSQFFGRESASGKLVTIDTTLQLATAFFCIRITAQAMSCLPVALYEKQGEDSRVKLADDPLAEVIGESPNQDQTALEFWEEMVSWLLANGNGYAEIVNPTGRRLTALQPIRSTHCTPRRRADGTLVYQVSDRGRGEELPREKIFHIRGFGHGLGSNRDLGLSPIAYGAQTMGTALSAEEVAGKVFSNGLQVSGMLKTDQALTKPQREQLQAILESYTGSTRAAKTMILEAGLDYKQLSLNPSDAQLLDTRRFSVEEICRWFGVPPIIVGHAAQGQTMWGSGVEQILIAWLTLGIDPLADRIEARIKKQLIRPTGNRRRYAEFNREALLQMDSAAKASFLSAMVQNGLMDRNEGRAKLNLPARPEAGALTAQTNLAPLGSLGQATDGNAARSALLAWLGIDRKEKQHEQA